MTRIINAETRIPYLILLIVFIISIYPFFYMISTSLMIKLGRVKGNKMIDMALSNSKLIDRGVRFVSDELKIGYSEAEKLLENYNSVREAIEKYKKKES